MEAAKAILGVMIGMVVAGPCMLVGFTGVMILAQIYVSYTGTPFSEETESWICTYVGLLFGGLLFGLLGVDWWRLRIMPLINRFGRQPSDEGNEEGANSSA